MTLPTKEELDALDMMPIYNQFRPVPEREYLLAPAGVEHYRLLKWVGDNNRDKRILELGHYMGLSAMSLADCGKNKICTADVTFKHSHVIKDPVNVIRRVIQHENYYPSNIGDFDIIFVDAWHNGMLENAIFEELTNENWRGILIYDDIYYNDAMKAFWNNINHPGKIDATHIGHSTGTGIIDFRL